MTMLYADLEEDYLNSDDYLMMLEEQEQEQEDEEALAAELEALEASYTQPDPIAPPDASGMPETQMRPPGMASQAPGGAIDHSSRETFIQSIRPYAEAAAAKSGLPVDMMIAIALNEQGWQSEAPGNNYFGIKGSNPTTGANTGMVNTWEDYGQGRVNTQDTFRAYDDPSQSFDDFGNFLESNPRYRTALDTYRKTGDADGLIRGIHRAGYATDPLWSSKITSLKNSLPPGGGSRSQNKETIDPNYGASPVGEEDPEGDGTKPKRFEVLTPEQWEELLKPVPPKPRRPTDTDALNIAGLLLYGVSYAAASAPLREAIKGSLRELDKAALAMYPNKPELGFRFLSPDEQRTVAASVQPVPINPEDDPRYRQRQAELKADLRRAEAVRLFDARRKALWDRQDRIRAESIERQRQKDYLAATTRQPTAMRPTADGRANTSGLSFSTLARMVPLADLRNLIDAWSGGSLGMTALSPAATRRLMSVAPVAGDAGEFLTILRQMWLAEGMPSLTTGGARGARADAPSKPALDSTRIRRYQSPRR